MVQSVNYLCGS